MRILLLPLIGLSLSGCIVAKVAETAVDVASIPVKATGKAIDLATTSQEEADRNRGRALRKAEEQYGRELREWERDCRRAESRGEPCPERPVFQPPE